MQQHSFADHESLSQAAAKQIFESVCAHPSMSICLATGGTPTRTYEILAELNNGDRSRFESVRIIKLDEWGGLPANHPATCEFYIRKYAIEPLHIPETNYLSFCADAVNREAECKRVREAVAALGPIDLCILGLGINGHLGFNEPAETLTPDAHIAELTAQTQQHPMVEDTAEKPTFGYTLGMANLLQSKKIMILVSGKHKEKQLQQLLSKKIDSRFPASFLWLHPSTDLYSDL